jgi:hypothetical protein
LALERCSLALLRAKLRHLREILSSFVFVLFVEWAFFDLFACDDILTLPCFASGSALAAAAALLTGGC